VFRVNEVRQAFVLGAGLGTRLRPLTDDLPKPLIPIFQKPLITFGLDHLIDLGIKKFFINTHRLPQAFAATFPDDRYARIKLSFVHEPLLLDTGGGIKNIEAELGNEPFITYSGDLLTDVPLQPLIDEHVNRGNDVTLALRKTILGSDIAFRDNRVVDISNCYGIPGEFDFANIAIWSPDIFERIPANKKISFIPVLADWIGQGGKIGGVVLNENKWFNIGSRAAYLDIHRVIAEENWKPRYVGTAGWPVRVAPDATLGAGVRLSGFYSIGSGCEIGEEVSLENTVVWPGAQIASRSQLAGCIVRSHKKVTGVHRDIDI
jgi:mannose-1-phosphate guanylyltransferase